MNELGKKLMEALKHGTAEDRMRIIEEIKKKYGSAEFFNRRWLDYAGLSSEDASAWAWTRAVHPDDVNRLAGYWRSILGSGEYLERAAVRMKDAARAQGGPDNISVVLMSYNL